MTRCSESTRRINILHVFLELGVGGAQQLLLTQLRHADRSKFNYAVCCLNGQGTLVAEAEALGVEVICLGRLQRSNDFGAIWILVNIMKSHNIDVVHTHLYSRSNVYGRVAGTMAGVPVIVATEHGAVRSPSWKEVLFDRVLWRYTHHVVAVSEAAASSWRVGRRRGQSKVSVIYNGIDPHRFVVRSSKREIRQDLHIGVDTPVIGVIARLATEKGHRYLLDAMPGILDCFPPARLVIVGKGPLQEVLCQQAKQLGISRNVMFLGQRRDIPELLKAMDVFVFPSLQEGLGLALEEAMVSQLPVVATRVGGIAELVIDGETGLLVPPRDSRALSSAVIALLADENKRRLFGQRGRARILKRFTAQRMVAELENLYRDLLASVTN